MEKINKIDGSSLLASPYYFNTSSDYSRFDGLEKLSLKVKKLEPEAVLPAIASEGDVGYDVVAINDGTISEDGTFIEYKTGLAIELPQGYHVELFPRSSISKYDLSLANSIGLVDNGYRGELRFRFKFTQRAKPVLTMVKNENDGYDQHPGIESFFPYPPLLYKKGDKIGQIVIRKSVSGLPVEEVAELSDTSRGSGGFGSTGK